jgi:tetratricopeptide (TPR) repeat protein
MLEASERDFPQDYNPPARLAAAYQAMKEWDKALAASDRALRLIYGPRKLRVLDVKADVLKSKGDLAGARRTMEEAVAFAEALPPGQRSDARVAALKKKLDSLKEASPASSS